MLLILFIMGWLVKGKQVTWLISRYNTASVSEQVKVDVEKRDKHFSNTIYFCSCICLGISLCGFLFQAHRISYWIGIVVLCVTFIFGIICLNTGIGRRKHEIRRFAFKNH